MIQTKNHGNKNKKYNKSEQFKLQKFTPELVVQWKIVLLAKKRNKYKNIMKVQSEMI